VFPNRKYGLSCAKHRPAVFSKSGFLRAINIYYVQFVVRHFWIYLNVNSGVPGEFGVQPPQPPKFRSFDKDEPNSQFHGKYIHNNLIRIRISLIYKLNGTND
jgi:hypothetical protein